MADPSDDRALAASTLTALGVVFGDLGTSPLYTMQTIVQATGPRFSPDAALGILSLLTWTLILVVSVKYCLFVMRADNHREGGILALMSLTGVDDWRPGAYAGAAMGLLGAALIYGDGTITPAISVLSALEGVNVATTALKPYILPVAIGILVALFSLQRFGTQRIGKAFGPIMLLWFVAIGALGLWGVLRHPPVLVALDPRRGAEFLIHYHRLALVILGGVFLCCTGAEALYADMGHVGRRPIRLAWYVVVLPALLLSYAGQAAMLVDGAAPGKNPFFQLAPDWARYPMVALATVATIIASQAIITGAFSMTRQAIQLGWLPRIKIRQTSSEEIGQVYIPDVNWLMAAATIAIAVGFGSSDKLAGAYGMAVSTTMLLTSLLLWRAMRRVWHWPLWLAAPVVALFLAIDLSFFAANLLKLPDGGYVPLALGAVLFVLMLTWRQGLNRVNARTEAKTMPVEDFKRMLDERHVPRVPGVGVFLTRIGDTMPSVIVDYVRSFGALPEKVVTVSVVTEERPRVPAAERGTWAAKDHGFWRVDLRYGFMQEPDVRLALKCLEGFGDEIDLDEANYFAARDFVVRCKDRPAMAVWRTKIFAFLFRNGARTPDRFDLPPERTIEIARQIEI